MEKFTVSEGEEEGEGEGEREVRSRIRNEEVYHPVMTTSRKAYHFVIKFHVVP